MSRTYARPLRKLYTLACLVVLVAALYFARTILIMLVLAALLSFLLSPFLLALERRGLRRLPAAGTAVIATLLLLVVSGLLISRQVGMLMAELPQHREAIADKIETLRDAARESWLSGFTSTLSELRERLVEVREGEIGEKPTPVEIVPSGLALAHSTLTPLADLGVAVGLVLILTFFILLRREDLRNRMIRLWGQNHLPTATKALDDAGRRIGSFLLSQLAVNTAFGVVYGLGLVAMGVPYPILGGFLGGLMRYIPFVGAWVAGAGPLVLSATLLPGWWHIGMVILLTALLEVTFAQLIEPVVFGRSIGVSEVALLVALAFWGWLWGVAGMILATPITACLVVFARHVPSLHFLAIILSDEPALGPSESFYQRLLANDAEEAGNILSTYRAANGCESVYEGLLLPALRMAKLHFDSGQIGPVEEARVYHLIREVMPSSPVVTDGEAAACLIVGIPAGETANELSLELFARLLPRGVAFEVNTASALLSEVAGRASAGGARVLVVGKVVRASPRQTKNLVKRLRKELPHTRILIGWWGNDRLSAAARRRLIEAGADGVASSFLEARAQLSSLLPVARQAAREEALAVGS